MTETNTIRNNRAVLLLIGGIPVTMILAATWLWYFVAHGDLDLVSMLGTANRGTLVQPPRQLDGVRLLDQIGLQVKFGELEPRWAMIIPANSKQCDAACEKSLYMTRQIHVATGKGFNRIRRLYVSESSVADTRLTVSELSDKHPTPLDFGTYLENEHRGLKGLTLEPGGYDKLFPEHTGDPSTWYLVDPAGWIMMSYNSDIPYKEVISDLKFLLKNSGG
jgi:hypothetical protein